MRRTARLLVASLLLAACGEGASGTAPVPDASTDVAPDATLDVSPDVAPDIAPDATPEASSDVAPDVAAEARVGCGADTDCSGDGGTRARCDTATGACVECLTSAHCAAGTVCVAGACVPGCSAERACPTGQTCCAGACVDPQSNVAHCGRCDARCAAPNATAACMNGRCAVSACTAPFADCDSDASNGCEADTSRSTSHCGACGQRCAARPNATAFCTAGRCESVCEAGFADCDGEAANGCEVDTRASAAHCGACGRACNPPNGAAVCDMGQCRVERCAEGFGDCDANATNGCEVDVRATTTHCGMCGRACPSRANALSGCAAGRCLVACVAGFADCDGEEATGCEVDTRTAAAHCGGCGRACGARPGATARCEAGACAYRCAAGRGDCDGDASNGCEADTTASAAHCGACGMRCASGVCRGGECQAPSCTDGVQNGAETDIDCGGACPRCGLGLRCAANSDCATAECAAGLCVDLDGSSCAGAPVVGPRGGFVAARTHASAAAMRGVGSIVGDGAGTLWALDPYGNGASGDRVLRVGSDGSVTTLAAPAGMSTCTSQQLARNAAGDLFVWNITPNALLRITAAGAVSTFSTVENIGGGGSCSDSGVQGVVARRDGTFALTSPLRGQLIALRADGTVAARLPGVNQAFRVALDGSSDNVLVAAGGRVLRVTPMGIASTVHATLGASALHRDGDGVIAFASGTMVFTMRGDGSELAVALACAGSPVTDVHFDRPTGGAAGTSLYVSTLGRTIDAFDGDAILELRRAR